MLHSVELPGGLIANKQLLKGVEFKAITGHVELAIVEAGKHANTLPEYINQLLFAVIETLADVPATISRIEQLSVGDRHFLLRELVIFFNGPIKWFNYSCSHCGEKFDLPIEWQSLPVINAQSRWAEMSHVIADKLFILQEPTGAIQKELATYQGDDFKSKLINACVISIDGKPFNEDIELNTQEMLAIEGVLENSSVQLITDLETSCPACEHVMQVNIDLVDAILETEISILEDVHYIASHYHWSENAILDLPRQRRFQYLELIEQSAGMER